MLLVYKVQLTAFTAAKQTTDVDVPATWQCTITVLDTSS